MSSSIYICFAERGTIFLISNGKIHLSNLLQLALDHFKSHKNLNNI